VLGGRIHVATRANVGLMIAARTWRREPFPRLVCATPLTTGRAICSGFRPKSHRTTIFTSPRPASRNRTGLYCFGSAESKRPRGLLRRACDLSRLAPTDSKTKGLWSGPSSIFWVLVQSGVHA
jgi:hypothetical protein